MKMLSRSEHEARFYCSTENNNFTWRLEPGETRLICGGPPCCGARDYSSLPGQCGRTPEIGPLQTGNDGMNPPRFSSVTALEGSLTACGGKRARLFSLIWLLA